MKAVTRLPTEIIDRGAFIEIVSMHPDTLVPWDVRLIEKDTKFGKLWASLDSVSRELSNAMQAKK